MPPFFQLIAGATSMLLAAGMAGEASTPLVAGPRPAGEGRIITARYSSSVLVFKVGEISLTAEIDGAGYAASTFVNAAGLAALFTDFDIHAEVQGRHTADGMVPTHYAHVERTGSKVRSVEVSFSGAIASAEVTPPFGSLGVPPASDAQRTGVIDPISAIFLLSQSFSADGRPVCSGSLPVFDGKARYDLRLEPGGTEQVRTPAWRGEATLCHVWYEPIAGYDPEDYPSESELRQPLDIWLAPFVQDGFYLPVRLRTRAGFGVLIEVSELDIQARP